VHFHEVGAIDSIVDIVGSCICLHLLGVEKVYSSELHDGKGFIKCQHGQMPVPVPAVMEMLKNSNIPLIQEDVNTELVTPTGMAIIKTIASGYGRMPVMKLKGIGYGMGKRQTGRFNALRVSIGEIGELGEMDEAKTSSEVTISNEAKTSEEVSTSSEVLVLEANIDDMTGEILGYTMDKLLSQGALDVYYTPIYMKKNRPAVMLSVICNVEKEDLLVDTILKETTTLGIRKSICTRVTMEREIIKVNTQYGSIKVKKSWRGDAIKCAPEYDNCVSLAKEKNIPLMDIYKAAEAAALNATLKPVDPSFVNKMKDMY